MLKRFYIYAGRYPLGYGRAAAALWRQRQMWIERRLLSTGQTDHHGRTDGQPTVT